MRRLRLWGLIAALLLVGASAQAAGTLRVGMQDDPDALDPALGGTFAGRIVFASLCDKLIELNDKLQFVPQLATAWSWSADSRTLTLTLRNGVTFQDGEKLDADAVKANIERYRSAPYSVRRSELKPVTAVEVVDPKTVRLVLSQPYAPLIAVLSDRAGMMAAPKVIDATGKDFFTHPVCAGPFSFVERVAQDHIALQRFPGYWNAGAIHLDRIEFHPIADSSVRLVGVQAGQLDMIEEIAPTDAAKVQQDSRLRLMKTTALGYEGMMINLGNGTGAMRTSRAIRGCARRSRQRSIVTSSTRLRRPACSCRTTNRSCRPARISIATACPAARCRQGESAVAAGGGGASDRRVADAEHAARHADRRDHPIHGGRGGDHGQAAGRRDHHEHCGMKQVISRPR